MFLRATGHVLTRDSFAGAVWSNLHFGEFQRVVFTERRGSFGPVDAVQVAASARVVPPGTLVIRRTVPSPLVVVLVFGAEFHSFLRTQCVAFQHTASHSFI